jgi:uncharacterized protein
MDKQSEINEITRELINLLKANTINFSKIILFGSYAKGTQNSESDIDFLVVSNQFRDKDIFSKHTMTKNIKWSLTDKFIKPFDILYYSDIEWEHNSSIPINEAKKYGIELIDK